MSLEHVLTLIRVFSTTTRIHLAKANGRLAHLDQIKIHLYQTRRISNQLNIINIDKLKTIMDVDNLVYTRFIFDILNLTL